MFRSEKTRTRAALALVAAAALALASPPARAMPAGAVHPKPGRAQAIPDRGSVARFLAWFGLDRIGSDLDAVAPVPRPTDPATPVLSSSPDPDQAPDQGSQTDPNGLL